MHRAGTVKLRTDPSRLDEMLSEKGVNTRVFSRLEVVFSKQRRRDSEHGIVGSARREIRLTFTNENLGSADCVASFLEQLPGLFFQAAIADSRTLARKALCVSRHAYSETNTRLRLRLF